MASVAKTKETAEFGDFQTPPELARKVCELMSRQGFQPASVIEPTCGLGNFLFAALDQFPTVTKAIGLDICSDYVQAVELKLRNRPDKNKVRVIQDSFFYTDWSALLEDLPIPMLVVGNPPWVTNAQLSNLGSFNVPDKSNFHKHNGFDAVTGKSNFDISEWMLIRILHWLDNRNAVMAMLCKTAVARKLLMYAWKNKIAIADSAIYHIDAAAYFGASVDACLLICHLSPSVHNFDSQIYDSIKDSKLKQIIGHRDGKLVASVDRYERWKHLQGNSIKKWRSGIKHDCAKVMELQKEGNKFRNGFGELIELEEQFLFPMLKSSEVANPLVVVPIRWMLVTQKSIREDPSLIKDTAPKTWDYLQKHAHLLNKRGSSIYKNRPQFSIFGVGDYSFVPWKVAISGFYKKLEFKVIGSYNDKPIVLDDTSNFIGCESQEEAQHIADLLNSPIAKEFFQAFIFWDAKRPITIELLSRLNLAALEYEFSGE